MKDVYLYNEDMAGYISENNLPFSDTSEFISGDLDNREFGSGYFNSKIKKAFKGQYSQGQEFLFENNTGTFDCLEKGYYKIILKADDATPGTAKTTTNYWWIYDGLDHSNTWVDSTNNNLIFNGILHQWNYLGESGTYEIYDQVIILYKEIDNIKKSVGVIDLSFLNTEYIDNFRQIKIKCDSTEVFYGKTFTSEIYNPSKDYLYIDYDGVSVKEDHELFVEYGDKVDGLFSRKKYQIDEITTFKGYTPTGAGGYSEIYAILDEGGKLYHLHGAKDDIAIGTTYSTLVSTKGAVSTELTSKERYTYQYKEYLNKYNGNNNTNVTPILSTKNGRGMINRTSSAEPAGKSTPIQSVGITTDKFGFHTYINNKPGYLKIKYLGPTTLSTVRATYNTLSNTTIIQDREIIVPRNTQIRYDFVYSQDLIQVNRGNPQNITSGSHVKTYRKGVQIGDPIPLNEISNFTRNSDYSESIEFTLGLDSYEFVFVEERKKFRIYYNDKYILKKDLEEGQENYAEKLNSHVTSIKISQGAMVDNDITTDEFRYCEVNDSGFTTIKIIYDIANWGLVRDFSAFSSRLTQLLDVEGASWTYSPTERADIITVKLNRDINLDLSHQGQLYLLYITYIKENNTIDKDFYLTPMRLKVGKIPYTIQKGSTLSAIYLTEGEDMWLDWGFEGDDQDFIKKLFVNETLSTLPPTYMMYPINVWPYNQAFVTPVKSDAVPDSYLGMDMDFNQVSSNPPALKKRNKPFQVLNFKMPPQITTIKLVISFQHYKFTFHRDDLGIIDAYISETNFIPGDIIKISFKLDKYHTLTQKLPPSYAGNKSYMDLLTMINTLYSYDSASNPAKNIYSVPLIDDKFSFFLIDKNYLDIKNVLTDTLLNFKFISTRNELDGWENDKQSIFYYPGNTGALLGHQNYLNRLKKLPEEELVSIYLVGQDKDIDLWLSPRLFPNNTLFIKKEGEVYYYQIEESGYYAAFLAGGRCGNGADGLRGLAAGQLYESNGTIKMDPNDPGLISFSRYNDGTESHGHPRTDNAVTKFWGKTGGDGGPGWYGGNGGDGGDGTGVMFRVYMEPLKIGFSLWHWSKTLNTGVKMPSIQLAGGKLSGHGGHGGNGVFPGAGGSPGVHNFLVGAALSDPGDTPTPNNKTVRAGSSDKLFIAKGTILLFIVGSNGKDGKAASTINTKLSKFNVRRPAGKDQSPDGGGGGPGSISLIGAVYSPVKMREPSGTKNWPIFTVAGAKTHILYALPRFCEDMKLMSRQGDKWNENRSWIHVNLSISTNPPVDGDFKVSFPGAVVALGWDLIVIYQCNWGQYRVKAETRKTSWTKLGTANDVPYDHSEHSPHYFYPGSKISYKGISEDIEPWTTHLTGGDGGVLPEEVITVIDAGSDLPALKAKALLKYLDNGEESNINSFCSEKQITYQSSVIGKDEPGIAFGFLNSGLTNLITGYKFIK
jgi:hypothetical protein